MNEYVNQFKQVSSDKEGEIVNKLVGKKNVLEVGYYAGQISLRLAEVTENLTCVDLPNKFFSPDLNDHILHNNIPNIVYEIVEDVIQYIKDNHHLFNGIYIDESHDKINGLLVWLEKNTKNTSTITVVYNDHATDSIKSRNIQALVKPEKTEVATDTSETQTPAPKKRTTKQSKTTTK
jgi:hypothetical protein